MGGVSPFQKKQNDGFKMSRIHVNSCSLEKINRISCPALRIYGKLTPKSWFRSPLQLSDTINLHQHRQFIAIWSFWFNIPIYPNECSASVVQSGTQKSDTLGLREFDEGESLVIHGHPWDPAMMWSVVFVHGNRMGILLCLIHKPCLAIHQANWLWKK